MMISFLELLTSYFKRKNDFILLLSCLIPFRKYIVYVLIFKGYFIM